MQRSDRHQMTARIRRARQIADLIDRMFPELAEKLTRDPDAVFVIAAGNRCAIERCADLPTTNIRADSGSYASWATWVLAVALLAERRRTAVSA